MAEDHYSWEELRYLCKRGQQFATTMELGIPIEEEGLSADELAAIGSFLHETSDHRNKRMLMDILGYGGIEHPRSYAGILEPFLRGPDALLAEKALEVLCDYWGLAGEYIETLRSFIQGEPWDERAACQRDAIDYAAQYLVSHAQPDLLQEIINLCENGPDRSSAHVNAFLPLATEHACQTLYRLVGYPDAPDSTVIQMAKERLAKERAQSN